MPSTNLQIRLLEKDEEVPLHLLLLADPSLTQIETYLPNATIYIADFDGQTIGCYVLVRLDAATVEIKNIAVARGGLSRARHWHTLAERCGGESGCDGGEKSGDWHGQLQPSGNCICTKKWGLESRALKLIFL